MSTYQYINRAILVITLLVLIPSWGIGQKKGGVSVNSDKQRLTPNQQRALELLRQIPDDINIEPDKPRAALIQAQAAQALWKYYEESSRKIFRRAFDLVRQPVPESATLDEKEKKARADLIRRQAAAIREILTLLGSHDKKTAEAWLAQYEQEQEQNLKNQSSQSNSPQRAELLAQIALELVKSNPQQAQQLGLLALSASEIPETVGRLLIEMGDINRDLADVLFRAIIMAMRRQGYAYSPALIPVSNYLFLSDGSSALPGPNVSLFISYLTDAINAQLTLWRDARTVPGAVLTESGARLASFLSTRGMAIIKANAPNSFQMMNSMLNELSAGLNQQQLRDIASINDSLQQQDAIAGAFEDSLDKQLRKAEQEKNQVVRDNLWRNIAVGMMRGDPERALSIAAKIDDQEMRAQTQDDIYLVLVGGKLRSNNPDEAHLAALKFNSPSLKAKSLAELADRALAAKDTVRATELLSEAYTIISKSENNADKFATILILAGKFSKIDPVRGFETLSSAIKTANQISTDDLSQTSMFQKKGPRVISYTMVGGAELSTDEHATLDTISFDALGRLVKQDFNLAVTLGSDLQNKLLRAKYLIAVADSTLRLTEQAPSKAGMPQAATSSASSPNR
ncbi:MAG TPA: hypothetical protein VF543_03220 [Pyrinomonadaceae bacterium]|jgi:hypothetical protein